MDKNTIYAIVIAFVVWIAWDTYLENKYPGYKERYGQNTPAEKVTAGSKEIKANNSTGGLSSSAPSSQSIPSIPEKKPSPIIQQNNVKLVSEQELTLHTPDLTLVFTQKEGSLKQVTLKKYRDNKKELGLLESFKSIFSGSKEDVKLQKLVDLEPGGSLPAHSYFYQIFAEQSFGTLYELKDKTSDSITFVATIGSVVVEKTYKFKSAYVVELSVNLTNLSVNPISTMTRISLYDQYKESEDKSSFLQAGLTLGKSAVVHAKEGFDRLLLKEIDEETLKEGLWPQQGLSIDWLGIDSQYFLRVIMPQSKKQNVDISYSTDGLYQISLVEYLNNFQPNQTLNQKYSLYMGPKDFDVLEKVGGQLEKSIDYGWLYAICVFILKMLKWIYGVVGNYGVAIIILTTIIKIFLLPLTWKASISMKRMQTLQPEMKKLQEKYKDDKQRLSQETMRFMKQNNMNPLGGCLPMIPQIPIFFSLYRVLYNSIELRQAPFFGWVTDLAAKDPLFIFPILTGASMLLQQKLMPTATTDPNQKTMFFVMNIFFTFMMLYLPSGAVLYILTNMILSIVQQLAINKYAKVD